MFRAAGIARSQLYIKVRREEGEERRERREKRRGEERKKRSEGSEEKR